VSEIIRVIALAIVTFFIIAVVLVFSNAELSHAVLLRFGLEAEQDATIEDGRPSVALVPGESVFAVRQPYRDRWTGLVGFPSNAELRFPLPHDLPVVGGQLQLVLNTQMVDNGDGLVTVTINGVQRDALVLDAGTHTRQLLYDLTAADLAGDAVVVALAGNGTTNHGQICPTNVTNLGAAVELASSSALLLQLSSPATSDEADLVTMPGPLRLDMSGLDGPIWAAQYLNRMAVPAELADVETADLLVALEQSEMLLRDDAGHFAVGGISGVEHLALLRGGALPAVYGQSWPVPVEALGADLQANTFRGSRRWEINYKLADLPQGMAPDVLNLNLATSTLGAPYEWVVRVILNDQLIYSAQHDGRSDSISQDIVLPADATGLTNRIVVVLTDPSPNQGICRAGPEAAAQMLDTTTFRYTSSRPANARESVVGLLAAAESVSFNAEPTLGEAGAAQASGLLDLVLPLTTPIRFGTKEAPVSIDAVDQQAIDTLLAGGIDDGEAYIVFAGHGSDPTRVEVEALSADTAPHLGSNGSALVVRWQ
jgi:hypothetical protein